MKNRLLLVIGLLLLAVMPSTAQNRVRFAGMANAADFAYGVSENVPGLRVGLGSIAANSTGTLTFNFGYVTLSDGTQFMPFSTTAPVTIGEQGTLETVTPSAVSCTTPAQYQTCSITVSVTYAHGVGDLVKSGSYGLQEALNYTFSLGGGLVVLNNVWTTYGGTNSTIATAAVMPNVNIMDNRESSSIPYWTIQPSATTALATGPTLTASTLYQATSCVSGAGGSTCTWSTNNPYCSVAYVDLQGNVGIGGTGFQPGALTASLSLVITAPAASTGAVGWIPFCGTTQNLLQYALPLTTTATGASNGTCTLTTLENVIPACAVTNATYNQTGSNGTFNTLYAATNMLIPQGASTTSNIWNPVFNAHSTFAYQPSALPPVAFESSYPAFPALTATLTVNNINVLGTAPLPAGYLNTVGRTVRITGKVTMTSTSGITPEIKLWYGAQSNNYGAAGIPTALCTFLPVGTLAVTTVNETFSCTLTTTAGGTTAAGAIQPEGVANLWGTGVTPLAAPESAATTVGSLGLFEPGQIFVELITTAQAASVAQLLDLHVETVL